jgi:hypothetical protein
LATAQRGKAKVIELAQVIEDLAFAGACEELGLGLSLSLSSLEVAKRERLARFLHRAVQEGELNAIVLQRRAVIFLNNTTTEEALAPSGRERRAS